MILKDMLKILIITPDTPIDKNIFYAILQKKLRDLPKGDVLSDEKEAPHSDRFHF